MDRLSSHDLRVLFSILKRCCAATNELASQLRAAHDLSIAVVGAWFEEHNAAQRTSEVIISPGQSPQPRVAAGRRRFAEVGNPAERSNRRDGRQVGILPGKRVSPG